MSSGKLRIGVEGARELDIDVEDIETAVQSIEQGLADGGIVWVEDSKGDRHGIVSGRLAFVEVEIAKERSVGFGL